MNYVKLIEQINNELKDIGNKPIYMMIADNFKIEDIELAMNKTCVYKALTKVEKNDFIKYLKVLKLQKALIL